MLPVIPDVGAAPFIPDQPLIKSIRAAEAAGGGKQVEGVVGKRGTKIPTVPTPTAINPIIIRSHL